LRTQGSPWAALAIAVMLGGCERPPRGEPRAAPPDSMGAAPTDVRRIPINARRGLRENSGATMSASQPDVLFSVSDAGNEPVLFALDTTGADRGAWLVRGARNVDWEAISSGPCAAAGADRARSSSTRCLYIGDVGDNDARRRTLTLYRLAEPRARTTGETTAISADALSFSLEGGPRDIEAMFVAPDGAVHLITKRADRSPAGRLRPARVYALPASAWSTGPAVARLVDSLPIVPGSAPLRTITDAALSADGARLAVRTYTQLFVFDTDPASGRVRRPAPTAVCDLVSLNEPQGEGITWLGARLLLSSEGRGEPLRIISCPGN
jgi:hypothetical protein